MVTILICNVWRLRGHTHEDWLLRTMIVSVMLGCLMDSASFTFDGVPGTAALVLGLISNTYIYGAEIVTCSCWAIFIHLHMRGSVSRTWLVALVVPVAICFGLLAINLFHPVLFHFDDAGIYSRLPGSVIVFFFSYSYFLYALALYIRLRRRGGSLRLFPGWALMFPVVVGGSVQFAFPQLPLFWAAVSIGIAATITSLQNEDIYRDRLTGLYNRAFLDYISSGKLKHASAEMAGIMIDLNGFKQINDRLGHTVGDDALVDAAHIVRHAVGDIGMTARYAGDEFVVLLNTRSEAVAEQTMDSIRHGFQAFDATSGKPYQLSAAMGEYPLEPGHQTVEEFIAAIDRAMYEDKKRYYEAHPEASRRHADA